MENDAAQNKSDPTVGAYFQCFKQPKSTIATISSFRNAYPDSTVTVISDGGFNYSDMCNLYKCNFSLEKRLGSAVGVVTSERKNIILWFERLINAAKSISEDYIMILEDDVRVFSPVKNLVFDLNGINDEVTLGKHMTAFLKSKNKHIPASAKNYYFGGCGGTIVRRQFLINHFRDIESTITLLEKYLDADKKLRYVSDYWLSVLILYFGGTIGNYRGFCETWYFTYLFRRYILRNIKTLHFDKSLHDLPLTDAERALLGDSFTNNVEEYALQCSDALRKSRGVFQKVSDILLSPRRITRVLKRKMLTSFKKHSPIVQTNQERF